MKTSLHIEDAAAPPSAAIRAELARIVSSPIFTPSPQLASFLKFVVEATLAGETETIKGYTIAVGALGRDENFDPQTDPIVRVEAGRLRRALERYYAEIGRRDPIRISLPRGSYVPVFEFAGSAAFAAATIVPTAHPDGDDIPTTAMPWYRRTPSVATVLVIVSLAIGGFALFDHLLLSRPWDAESADAAQSSVAAARVRASTHPVLLVEPVEVEGTAPAQTLSASALHIRLSDAIARSDNMTLVAAPRDTFDARFARKPDYRLASTLTHNGDVTLSLTVRLIDAADATVVWTRKFDDLRVGDDPRAVEFPIVREIATRLGEPYGVLFAHRRAKLGTDGDSRRRCVFETYDYLRDRIPAQHPLIRDCLERAVAADPSFAIGHSLLALVHLSEYLFNMPARPDDADALDRALASAVEALQVKPSSAFAHAVLVDVYANRGELDDAKAAGRKALELNPYDATINLYFGTQMIFRGEIDYGRAVLGDYLRLTPAPPPRANYALFLAAYSTGAFAEAARHANRLTNPNCALSQLARALAAVKADDLPRAREALNQFYRLQPAWKIDPRGQLRKHHPAQAMFERLAAELEEAARRALM